MNTNVNWYLVVAAAAVLLIGAVLRKIPGLQRTMPHSLAAGILGFVLGAASGIVSMHYFGYHWYMPALAPVTPEGPLLPDEAEPRRQSDPRGMSPSGEAGEGDSLESGTVPTNRDE